MGTPKSATFPSSGEYYGSEPMGSCVRAEAAGQGTQGGSQIAPGALSQEGVQQGARTSIALPRAPISFLPVWKPGVSAPRTWMSRGGMPSPGLRASPNSWREHPPQGGASSSQARHRGVPHVPWGPCQANHTTLAPGPPVRPCRRRTSKTWIWGPLRTYSIKLRGAQGQLMGPTVRHGARLFLLHNQ